MARNFIHRPDFKEETVLMLDVILGALLPVIVTLGLGAFAGWRGDEDWDAAQSLNKMVLQYALPITLFTGTITIPRHELLSDWPLLVVLLTGTLLPYGITFFTSLYLFKRGLQAAALQALAFGLPAIAFTGIPILTPLIQSKTTVVVDFAGLTTSVIVLPVTLLILTYAQSRVSAKDANARDEKPGATRSTMLAALRSSLTQPIVLSPLLAMVLVLLDLHLPGNLTNSFKLLGSTVGGISLFASGIILQAKIPGFSAPASISTVGRLLLIPGITYFALRSAGHTHDLTKMAVLALALPAAPMQVMLATRFKCCEEENSAVLLYTNVFCIPTLALFIFLTQ